MNDITFAKYILTKFGNRIRNWWYEYKITVISLVLTLSIFAIIFLLYIYFGSLGIIVGIVALIVAVSSLLLYLEYIKYKELIK